MQPPVHPPAESNCSAKLPTRLSAFRIAVIFAAVGALWVLATEWLQHSCEPCGLTRIWWGCLVGLLYVTAAAVFLGWLLDRCFRGVRLSATMLGEGEKRWKLAIEGSSQAVWEWNPLTNEAGYSPEWKTMLGYGADETADELANWEPHIHPEDLPQVREALKRHLEGLSPEYTSEHRIRCKDGSYKWILDRGKVTSRSPEGDALLLAGTFSDIHSRKLEEIEFRRKESIIRMALDAADTVTWELDAKLGRITYSDNLSEMARSEDLSPYTSLDAFGDQVHPDDQERTLEAIGRTLRTGDPFECEYRVRLPDGGWHWLAGRGRSIRDVEGRVTKVVGASQDITRRKQAEESLMAEASRRSILVEGSRDGIVVLDRQGKVVEANRRFAEMLGYTADEVMRLHVSDWDRNWPPDKVKEAIRDLGPEGTRLESRHYRKDGSFYDVELSNSAAELHGEKLVFCVCHDMTERNRAKEALDESLLFMREAEKIARLGAWKVNPATDYLYWTEGVYDILEAPLDYKPGLREGLAFYDAECIPLLLGSLEAALKDGTPFSIETGLTTATGRHIWTEVRGFGRVEEDGQPYAVGTFQDITERRNAKIELEAAHARLNTLFQDARDAIFFVDADTGIIEEANQAASQMMMLPRERIIGMHHMELHPSEYFEEYKKKFASHASGSLRLASGVILRADGVRVRVEVSGRLTKLPDGRSIVQGIFRDITERERQESHTRLHLRTLQQLAADEPLDRVLESVVNLLEIGGEDWYGAIMLVSEDRSELYLGAGPRIPDFYQNAVRRVPIRVGAGSCGTVAATGRPVLVEDISTHPYWVAFRECAGRAGFRACWSLPILSGQGEVLGVISVYRTVPGNPTEEDIREIEDAKDLAGVAIGKTRSEEALREREERFRQLVETSYDWIWEMDSGMRYTYTSPKSVYLLGYKPHEMLGKSPFDFMQESEAGRMREVLGEIAARRKPFASVESTSLHKSGREVVLESSGSPVFGPDGGLAGFRGMDRDISERKRMEAQLRQAQKMEAVGLLAGGVAHDFNNILAAMMMNLGMLQMNQDLDPQLRTSLEEIDAEARRAADLTRQLLMFSRRSVLAVRPLDLNDVVANLLKMLGRLIGEHVGLQFRPRTGLAGISADAGLLEQAVVNLVVNARDSMTDGGSITITTDQIDLDQEALSANSDRRAGRFVCLAVEDTGHGIDPATLKRIFEPFFTTKDPGRGTGLGLATLHGIIAQHQGWVEVDSEVGKGSTFRIYLPAASTPVVSDSRSPAAAAPVPGGREVVMVVEDDIKVREMVVMSLQHLGYQVHSAATGQDCIDRWSSLDGPVDLLLTDMVMPEGLSGLDLAGRLRETQPDLRVIISSGYSAEMVETGAPDVTSIHYLPKPYKLRVLAETVRKCLDQPVG